MMLKSVAAYIRRDMNASQDDVASGLSLGVLIIGSLYWDCKRSERVEWRRKRLDLDRKCCVRAPIRYGRCSSTRGDTYTMVFSPSLDKAHYGHGIAIRCKSQDIVQEAECLWAAESNGKGGVSAPWGCVGLLPNPDSTRLPSEQCKRWSELIRGCGERRSNYRELAKVSAGVNENGFLTIPWPKLANGSTLAFDALLATATKPTSHDPQPSEIASRWKTPRGKEHVYYFYKNRKNGIETSQDVKIGCLLAESGSAR